ncbi:MAG: helix-hairpin-helix domain-containing protein, partial [Patescibacteria group bacterium]|nr:helix-hairpin-helix domain-containing protein [Patescibacteria group bacterium]
LSKNLNLAQKVSDGMKVYIPKTEEAGKSATPVASGESSVSSLININSATAEELDKLPGVGSTTAQNIIGKRPYGSIEELLTKKAVSRAVYEKIKGAISAY